MFRWVFISENVPRDLKTLNANLSEGLQGLNFFGYFFLIGGIFFLVIAIMKIRMLFPYIGIFAVIIVGHSMLSKSKKTLERRQTCFTNGIGIEGKVVKQGRAMNPFSSTSKYTITVKTGDKSIEITHKSKDLWASCKIGDTIIGLKNNEEYFFGPEIGCIFKYFEPK